MYIPPGKQQGTPLIPPREEHWHGGTADNVMCHLAMLEGGESGDGGKYLAELDKEEQLGKYTLAELEEEEEEQGLNRLRRWYRELLVAICLRFRQQRTRLRR